MKTKIYVACHNSLPTFEGDILVPIQVGKSLSAINLDILGDNSGDNISELNPHFCELTALYWIWKNGVTNSDYIGLYHYRRFFLEPKFRQALVSTIKKYKYLVKNNLFFDCDYFSAGDPLISSASFERLKLDSYDMILPRKYFVTKNVMDDFCRNHLKDDLDTMRCIVLDKYYDWLDAFDLVMESNYLYPFNMFILKSELYCEFCSWLFPILFEVYAKIDVSNRDVYQSRVCGFLSERLFTVFITKKLMMNPHIKIKELFVIKK
ncbi:MAG TPA: DUF4422 domain-containing protein [Burkholderiales bacterium]|jgi:hypothetical protein|nr:DUF4422 domain-containing protein [Burkholderiales bacterium]